MRKLLLLSVAGLLFSGCSKTDELTNEVGTNLVNRIKTPIEEARAVSAKAAATREIEPPK
jgi:uncharacterized protein YcfL